MWHDFRNLKGFVHHLILSQSDAEHLHIISYSPSARANGILMRSSGVGGVYQVYVTMHNLEDECGWNDPCWKAAAAER